MSKSFMNIKKCIKLVFLQQKYIFKSTFKCNIKGKQITKCSAYWLICWLRIWMWKQHPSAQQHVAGMIAGCWFWCASVEWYKAYVRDLSVYVTRRPLHRHSEAETTFDYLVSIPLLRAKERLRFKIFFILKYIKKHFIKSLSLILHR